MHCVHPYQCLAELVQQVREGQVDLELNIVFNGEVLGQILEVLDKLPILLIPTATNNNQLHFGPLLLSYDLPKLKHGLNLQRVVLFWSELSNTKNAYL